VRSSRWHVALIVLLVALAATTDALGVRVVPITTLIAEKQVATWRCEDQRAVPRTRPAVEPWALPRSTAYRRWVLHRWQERYRDCIRALHARDGIIRTLNRGLQGTPMAGTGRELERAGRRHHVHPAFIAAIAGTESSFGHAACSNNPRNAFGLSSCGSGWRVPYFETWEEAYDFMARFLSGRWPNASSTYSYHGYAACSSCWGRKTASWMSSRFGIGNTTRYS
jgi:hypothetical protein